MTRVKMEFPKTWKEYEGYYGFKDEEEVYTNGSRLIPSFRVQQWLDHLEQEPLTDVLDKIRAEIEQMPSELTTDGRRMIRRGSVFRIIEKYRKEKK